jgi:ATP-dependent DNA helicase RecG
VLFSDVGINVGLNVGINERVLSLIEQDSKSTAQRMAERLGVSQRQVERALSTLKKEGRIIRQGSRKNGWWEVLNE